MEAPNCHSSNAVILESFDRQTEIIGQNRSIKNPFTQMSRSTFDQIAALEQKVTDHKRKYASIDVEQENFLSEIEKDLKQIVQNALLIEEVGPQKSYDSLVDSIEKQTKLDEKLRHKLTLDSLSILQDVLSQLSLRRQSSDTTSRLLLCLLQGSIQFQDNTAFNTLIVWIHQNQPDLFVDGRLQHLLNLAFQNPSLSDWKIVIYEKEGDESPLETLPVNGNLLKPQSAFFRATIEVPMKESQEKTIKYNLSELSKNSARPLTLPLFKDLIRYFYTGKITSCHSLNDWITLLHLADYFDMQELKKFIHKTLWRLIPILKLQPLISVIEAASLTTPSLIDFATSQYLKNFALGNANGDEPLEQLMQLTRLTITPTKSVDQLNNCLFGKQPPFNLATLCPNLTHFEWNSKVEVNGLKLKFFQQFSSLESLKLGPQIQIAWQAFTSIQTQFTSLHTLQIGLQAKAAPTSPQMETWRHWTRLKALELFTFIAPKKISGLNQLGSLEELYLNNQIGKNREDGVLEGNFISQLTNLKSLILEGFNLSSELLFFCFYNPYLNLLKLKNGTSDHGLAQQIKMIKSSKLTELHFNRTICLPKWKNFPNLKDLTITCLYGVDSKGLAKLSLLLTNLKIFVTDYPYPVGLNSLQWLSRLPQLRLFHLRGASLERDALAFISHSLPSLQELVVNMELDAEIFKILEAFQNLTHCGINVHKPSNQIPELFTEFMSKLEHFCLSNPHIDFKIRVISKAVPPSKTFTSQELSVIKFQKLIEESEFSSLDDTA